jgi:hypothetical protein
MFFRRPYMNRSCSLLLTLSLIAAACQQQGQSPSVETPAAVAVDHQPFHLHLQFLPQRYLNAVHATPADSACPTTTFRLRVTSLPDQPPVSELLRQAAPPDWSANQLQLALLYQLDSFATLTVNKQRYSTILATTETVVDASRAVDLVFVFGVPERVVRRASPVEVKLAPSFFLTTPVSFTLPLAAF